MIDSQLLKQVRRIQLKTSNMVTELFAGEYASVFKGQGMEFESVREYQPGDEIRSIDWNVTARMNRPFIKEFREERELTLFFIVDISSSMDMNTHEKSKREIVAELCALLAFAAIQNNDKVGVLLFSDHVEQFIPPAKGKKHVLRVIRELLETQSSGSSLRKTDLSIALEYFAKIQKKRSVCFVVSDFFSDAFEKPLGFLSQKHDLIAVHIEDPLERHFPKSGLVQLKDLESNTSLLVDFSDPREVNVFKASMEKRKALLVEIFRQRGIDCLNLQSEDDYFPKLVQLFKRREKKIRK